MGTQSPSTIDQYIRAAPPQCQPHLREVYRVLKDVAPEAKEAIKWGNPVFEEQRILFAFSAHKAHMNFMPTPAALEPFLKELGKHKTGKGSVQIPYDKPVPEALLRKVAAYRIKDVRENDARWM